MDPMVPIGPTTTPEDEKESASPDPLEQVFARVMRLIYREQPLSGNQILDLAARVQRAGVHRVAEEAIARRARTDSAAEKTER